MRTATYNEIIPTAGNWFAEMPRALWSSIKHASRTHLQRTQTAQLTRALYSMSDAQLVQIGTTRQDIPLHVRKIMSYEYDGL